MKHAYSFLAGSVMVSLTVFATRSLPGYMFLAGFIVCVVSVVILGRAIGASRLARFFSYLEKRNSIRLSPHWSSGEEKSSTTQSRTRRSADVSRGSVVPRFKIRSDQARSVSPAGVSGSHGYTSSPVSGQAAAPDGYLRTPWVGGPHETAESGSTGDNPARQRKEIRMRCNSSAAQNENSGSDVQSSNRNKDVLPQTQQDVLSALLNLKVPYAKAEEAVRGSKGVSFDDLFREALAGVTAGDPKSRRAVA